MEKLVQRGLLAKRESKYIEFKKEFNIDSNQAWCEIIKDIIAISNSGGGIIIFGVDDKGKPINNNVAHILELDSATITDKIYKYTGVHFSDFSISKQIKQDTTIAVLEIKSTSSPIVFSKPGTYDIGGGKQERAFSQGTVYFRHGAKSEPGLSEDIMKFLNKQVKEERKQILKNLRKVVSASQNHEIILLPRDESKVSPSQVMEVRVVDDASALPVHKIDHDTSHPLRQKDVIREVNNKLPQSYKINQYDILVVIKIFNIPAKVNFAHKPKFSTRQYSYAFVEWLVEQFNKDILFFTKTRAKYASLRSRK